MQKTTLGIGSNCHISTGWTQKSAIFVWNLWPYYVSRSHAKKSQLHMFVFQVCKLSYWETISCFIIKSQYQPNIKNILIKWMSSYNNRVNQCTKFISEHRLYLTKICILYLQNSYKPVWIIFNTKFCVIRSMGIQNSNKQQLNVTMDSYRTYSACSLSKHQLFGFLYATQNCEKFEHLKQ